MTNIKKRIKIAFMDFWTEDYVSLPLYRVLSNLYDVEICEKDYDYAIFSVFGNKHLDIPTSCVSLCYTGENLCPDFNLCDYAIGFEWLKYGDRYLRFPNYYLESDLLSIEQRSIDKNTILKQIALKQFCSFVVSNNSTADPIRMKMYEKLSQYKRINSGGRFMNNIGGPVEDKRSFESQHKFCLTFENSRHSGYTTEKLVDAFASGGVPIYWGDPEVTKVFNPKAFVLLQDESELDEVIERIKRLDNNDDEYIAMLQEPIFVSGKYSYEVMHNELEQFLRNIFDQPKEDAYRYSRCSRPIVYRNELINMRNALPYRSLRYNLSKKIQKLKKRFIQKK